MAEVIVVGFKCKGRDIVLKDKRICIGEFTGKGKVFNGEVAQAESCFPAEEVPFVFFCEAAYSELIDKQRGKKMKMLYLPGAYVEEHLGIHIVDTGGDRVIDRFIEEERHEISRIYIGIIIDNAVPGRDIQMFQGE